MVKQMNNDYLQALVETGAVGSACVVWFIAVLDRQAFKQITNWTHHWDGALRVAAFFASCAVSTLEEVMENRHYRYQLLALP